MPSPSLVITVYVAVLVAEMLGDKTLYTLGALAARYPARHLAPGALAAFMAKMAVAVAAGRALHSLPPWALRGASAVTFFAMAVALWRRPARAAPTVDAPPRHWSLPSLAAFAAVFGSEWCDPGQLTAAALAARHGAAWWVWAAATAAMATKGALGLAFGVGLRRWVPHRAVRPVSVAVSAALGVAAAVGFDP